MKQTKSKKTAKKSQSGIFTSLNKKRFYPLYVFLVFVVGYFAIYMPLSIHTERKSFEKAAVELELLAEEIQQLTGPAEEVTFDKNCGESSEKIDEGTLYCTLDLTVVNKLERLTQDEVVKSYESFYEVLFSSEDFLRTNEIKRQDIRLTSSGFECSASFVVAQSASNHLRTAILCSKQAIVKHY